MSRRPVAAPPSGVPRGTYEVVILERTHPGRPEVIFPLSVRARRFSSLRALKILVVCLWSFAITFWIVAGLLYILRTGR